MDDTAPPTVESLQERVRELEKANAELVADKGTLVHVATELARVLSLQRPFLEPEGVWIQDGDLEWMDKIVELSRQGEDLSHGPYDRVWRWQKVSSLFVSPTCASTRGTARHPSPDVPCSCFLKGLQARKEGFVPKLPKSKSWHDRQLEARVAKRPFSRTFPLELFEAIIAHADTRAISRTAQASFACYQLFMPVLLDRVHAVSRMYSPGLRTLFAARDASLLQSARLNPSRSFCHIRTLSLESSSLRAVSQENSDWTFDRSRLPSGSTALHLDALTITIDEGPQGKPQERSLQKILSSNSAKFLVRLDPAKLVINVKPEVRDAMWGAGIYVVSHAAAMAMAQWSRLRHVRLADAAHLITARHARTTVRRERDGVFFLAHRGASLGGLSGGVSIVWDVSDCCGAPSWGYRDMLQLLLTRDDTLRQAWVSEFKIVLMDDEDYDEFQDLVHKSKQDVPACLKWKVNDRQRL